MKSIKIFLFLAVLKVIFSKNPCSFSTMSVLLHIAVSQSLMILCICVICQISSFYWFDSSPCFWFFSANICLFLLISRCLCMVSVFFARCPTLSFLSTFCHFSIALLNIYLTFFLAACLYTAYSNPQLVPLFSFHPFIYAYFWISISRICWFQKEYIQPPYVGILNNFLI